MIRHLFLAITFALCALFIALPAWAGSYLDRASLLLDEARKEGDLLQPRTHDKELVLVIHALAEARARVAARMECPASVSRAHPHLLLVLENSERAADAAAQGNFKKFMEHLTVARNEDRAFRAILAELGYTLPTPRAQR
ncbi:hypothetical protein SOCEGT47_015660 [Sorangium cellulosum]|uniref:Uncharacterized protein n=1 Tax=Sorangium cellulosum TaxID=56 RepID=A0A4P2PX44_SORCE|nr:hypothetical protein [Sorangium cellulosum]AUX21088.1 hypothetical protein SOCEGT47_015660 [Sorangium cellulosum]